MIFNITETQKTDFQVDKQNVSGLGNDILNYILDLKFYYMF